MLKHQKIQIYTQNMRALLFSIFSFAHAIPNMLKLVKGVNLSTIVE